MISYKYNIYHSRKTKYLDEMLRECCFVWNHALALQRRYHKLFGKYISVGKMKKYFAKRIKRNLLHSQTTQEILERLDESYNRFFKKLAKRPPKFKSPEKFNSFVFKQGGFTLNGNCLTINKGNKRFRFSYSRGYEGNVKQIRIVRETCSRFSLIVVTDHNPISSYRKTHDGASIGLDFGLKTYLTKSDGSKIDSPLFFKQYQNKIRKLNKRLSNFSFIISKTPYSFVIITCFPGFILHRLKYLVTFIVALNNDISYLVFPFLSRPMFLI